MTQTGKLLIPKNGLLIIVITLIWNNPAWKQTQKAASRDWLDVPCPKDSRLFV